MQIRNQILQADRPELYNPPFHMYLIKRTINVDCANIRNSSRFVHEAVQKVQFNPICL